MSAFSENSSILYRLKAVSFPFSLMLFKIFAQWNYRTYENHISSVKLDIEKRRGRGWSLGKRRLQVRLIAWTEGFPLSPCVIQVSMLFVLTASNTTVCSYTQSSWRFFLARHCTLKELAGSIRRLYMRRVYYILVLHKSAVKRPFKVFSFIVSIF